MNGHRNLRRRSPLSPLPLLAAVATLLFGAADAAEPAARPAGQVPSPPPGSSSLHLTPASVGGTQAAPGLTSAPPHHHRRRRRRHHHHPAAIDANAAARSFPRPDAYVNATLYFDYEAGRLYQLQTSPHFLTAIMLRPGERLVSKAAGDTVRWVIGETVEGAGVNQRVVVLLKPIRGGLRTNLVLTTDQRSYLIEAASREDETYTSAVTWNYPQEQMAALAAARAAEASRAAASVGAPAVPLDQLNFGYHVEAVHTKPPRWQPLHVFDDGTKTYIQFPVNMAATEAPPLFLIGSKGTVELVNYRFLGGYYVVDRLIDVAELRIGEKPQTVVRITRSRDRS